MIKQVAAASILALTLGSAQAGIVIDDFTNNQLVRDPATADPSSTVTGGAIVGSSRDMTVDCNGGQGSLYAASNSVNPSILVMGHSGDATGIVTVQWNGIADLDFAGGGATGNFLSFTNPIDHVLTVAFDATDGSTHSTATRSFANGSQGPDFFLPFSIFSDLGVSASVNNFSATFTSPTANWDAGVDFIETRDVPVPAPGVLALMTIGLTGLRISRRRAA
jgi:hypothetical protein